MILFALILVRQSWMGVWRDTPQTLEQMGLSEVFAATVNLKRTRGRSLAALPHGICTASLTSSPQRTPEGLDRILKTSRRNK